MGLRGRPRQRAPASLRLARLRNRGVAVTGPQVSDYRGQRLRAVAPRPYNLRKARSRRTHDSALPLVAESVGLPEDQRGDRQLNFSSTNGGTQVAVSGKVTGGAESRQSRVLGAGR